MWFSSTVIFGWLLDGGEQRPLDLAAGDVAGVEDAALGVAAFAAEIEFALAILQLALVELHAEVDQLLDAAGPSLTMSADHGFIAQPGAGVEGIAHVELEGILAAGHAGDAALRPGGVRFCAAALGNDDHRAVGGGRAGEAEPGHAAADDGEIVALSSGRGRRGMGRRMLSMSRVFPNQTAQAMTIGGGCGPMGARESASRACDVVDPGSWVAAILRDARGAPDPPAREKAARAAFCRACAEDWRLRALLGREIKIARAQGEAIRLANGGSADDFYRQIQVAHHAADDGALAGNPSRRRPRHRAPRYARASAPRCKRRGNGRGGRRRKEAARPAPHRHRSRSPRVDFRGAGVKEQIGTGFAAEAAIAGERARVTGEILLRAELGRVDKNARGHRAVWPASFRRAVEEREMAGVQRAHGGDEDERAARLSGKRRTCGRRRR